jgi:hypothetical protein
MNPRAQIDVGATCRWVVGAAGWLVPLGGWCRWVLDAAGR